MPTFYRTRSVRITDRMLQVSDPVPAVYLIEELGPVWTVSPGPARVAVRVSCAGGAAVVVVLLATQPDPAAGWVMAVLVLGVLAVVLMARRPEAPSADYVLMSTWRGEWVCLYWTHDQVEFGQVRRALQRAVEWRAQDAAR